MQIFNLTLQQMLMMFLLMAIGFILRKTHILPDNAGTVMAKLETYAIVPALTLYTQMTNCTVETFTKSSTLILYGLVLVLISVAVAYPLSKLFVRRYKESTELEYQRNIYKYAMAFGNFGYIGDFIVLGVFGTEAFFKYTLFKFFISIVCSAWGIYILVPKGQGASFLVNLKKGLLTPPLIALVLGVIMGLLNLSQYVPDFIISALDNTGKCQGPIAMILAGFVVGGYKFKELLLNKKVYIATAMRLVILPAAIVGALLALRPILTQVTPEELYDTAILPFALIVFATPLGLNTIVYPATYGGDTKTGAAMTMISSVLSVITIPLMYLLFIVVL